MKETTSNALATRHGGQDTARRHGAGARPAAHGQTEVEVLGSATEEAVGEAEAEAVRLRAYEESLRCLFVHEEEAAPPLRVLFEDADVRPCWRSMFPSSCNL